MIKLVGKNEFQKYSILKQSMSLRNFLYPFQLTAENVKIFMDFDLPPPQKNTAPNVRREILLGCPGILVPEPVTKLHTGLEGNVEISLMKCPEGFGYGVDLAVSTKDFHALS